MATGTKYNKEFKEQAVDLALRSPEPIRKIAKDLGITEQTLYRWKNELSKKSKPKTSNPQPNQDELLAVKKENQLLKMELEILKKAAAYFARNQA